MKLSLTLISLLWYVVVTAQPVVEIGPFNRAILSGTTTINPWSASLNPALLPLFKQSWIGVSHINRFLVSELSQSEICWITPVEKRIMGFHFSHFGTEFFNQQQLSVSIGYKWNKNVLIGGQIQMVRTSAPYSLEKSHLETMIKVGVMFIPTSRIRIAWTLAGNSISFQQSLNPRIQGSLGTRLQISPRVRFFLEFLKRLSQPIESHVGITFIAHPKIQFSLSLSPVLFRFEIGSLVNWKSWTIHLSLSTVPHIGSISNSSILYRYD